MAIPTLLLVADLLVGQTAAESPATPPSPSSGPAATCEALNPDLTITKLNFDTKGVDFVPWVRDFVKRVQRNWTVPDEAKTLSGCAIVSFRVLKDGTILDITRVTPSGTPSFTEAGYKALAATASLAPLPREYPDDSATITVTFFYNNPRAARRALFDNTLGPPSSALLPSSPPDVSSQPEPTAAPTRFHGHSATFRLSATKASDPVDVLRWFATGNRDSAGQWLVEHEHGDGPVRSFCRGLLTLDGAHLVFRSENVAEGFVATAQELTTVNRGQATGSFTISFR